MATKQQSRSVKMWVMLMRMRSVREASWQSLSISTGFSVQWAAQCLFVPSQQISWHTNTQHAPMNASSRRTSSPIYTFHFYTVCPERKRSKCFFAISSIKLGRFWQNLSKLAAKWCKRFPPRPNNVSTLPCEIWNAYLARSTIESLQKETPQFIPPQLASKFARFQSNWFQRMETIAKKVYKHAWLIWTNWNCD